MVTKVITTIYFLNGVDMMNKEYENSIPISKIYIDQILAIEDANERETKLTDYAKNLVDMLNHEIVENKIAYEKGYMRGYGAAQDDMLDELYGCGE